MMVLDGGAWRVPRSKRRLLSGAGNAAWSTLPFGVAESRQGRRTRKGPCNGQAVFQVRAEQGREPVFLAAARVVREWRGGRGVRMPDIHGRWPALPAPELSCSNRASTAALSPECGVTRTATRAARRVPRGSGSRLRPERPRRRPGALLFRQGRGFVRSTRCDHVGIDAEVECREPRPRPMVVA
jgi:hypothetical protein